MNLKQKRIIASLRIKNGQRYSEIYKDFSDEDKFPYHLKQVIKYGYVNKRNLRYYLTRKGNQVSQTFNSSSLEDVEMKIPIFLFVCKFENKYLIKKILENSRTCDTVYVLPGAKATVGIKIHRDIADIIYNKHKIRGDIVYRCTQHLIEYTSTGEIMFDDILLVFDVDVESAELPNEEYIWLTKEDIHKLPRRHKPIDELILCDNRDPFQEISLIDNFNINEQDL